jgi:hypothetical protein
MGLRDYLASCGHHSAVLPEIAGRYAGRGLVIVGDARGVWEDLEAFGCRVDDHRGKVAKAGYDFMTVNKAVETFPGDVEHAYSNSADCLKRFIPARRDEYAREFKGPAHVHALYEAPDVICWPWHGRGTSALGATLAGIALGYERIVLAGIPLDDGPHNGEPHWRKTAFATSEAAGGQRTGRESHWWAAKQICFDDRVRSMSGRTREWLGDAREWALPSPACSDPAGITGPMTSPICATESLGI